ncbi:WD40-repeat-containing domain protein, partial [Jimgerdemannia flammicorona]
MVKAYLRYEPKATFGIIASVQSNAIYNRDGKLAIAPALEDVVVWDLKKGTQVAKWHESTNKAEVTCIARSPNEVDYAVGYVFFSPALHHSRMNPFVPCYNDGSIRLWSFKTSTCSVTFNGHRSAVTALAFDKNGTRLASGSRDTDLIVWDVVGEVGLYRLRGHKDQITCLYFLTRPTATDSATDATNATTTTATSNYLLSSSKDTLLKLWDLTTQHCVETLIAHRGEIWAFDVSRDQSVIVTGGSDADMKAWRVNWERLAGGEGEDEGVRMEMEMEMEEMKN